MMNPHTYCSYKLQYTPPPFYETLYHKWLKAYRQHLCNYPHTPTDYRHTDKHLRLVMVLIGQTVQPREVTQTDGRSLPSTLSIISLALRSIKMYIILDGPLLHIWKNDIADIAAVEAKPWEQQLKWGPMKIWVQQNPHCLNLSSSQVLVFISFQDWVLTNRRVPFQRGSACEYGKTSLEPFNPPWEGFR